MQHTPCLFDQRDDPPPRATPPPQPLRRSEVQHDLPDVDKNLLLLTERDAAKAMSISPRTLWQLRIDEKIPHLRFGRAVRYDPHDLKAWINARKTHTGTA